MGSAGAIIERYRDVLETGDMSQIGRVVDEIASDDFVQEWPQSGERIRKENVSRLNEMYSEATGTSPKMTVGRVTDAGDRFVVEGTIDYGDGTPVRYIGIGEVRDGRVSRMTEYFASPFEAPAWRSHLVERMEPVAV